MHALRLGSPLLLAVLELGHPRGASADLARLMPIADWWLTLHLLQVPLFWLATWSILDLVRSTSNPFSRVSRVALQLFAVSFTVLDLLGGVGTGLLAKLAATWPPEQQVIAADKLQVWMSGPVIGTRVSVVDFAVANAWLVGLFAAAIAFAQAYPGRYLTCALLAVAGLAMWFGGHAAPFGPIAMARTFLAVFNGHTRDGRSSSAQIERESLA